MALVTALEKCVGSAPIRPTEPIQYIVVAIEHDRKYIPPHTSISLLDDTLLCDCKVNQEIKRRTRVVRIFPNRGESCLRLASALAVEQSEEWVTGRRYLNMEELKEWHSKGPIGKEVLLTKR